MENTFIEILSTIGLDALVFIGLFIGFTGYRKLRSPPVGVDVDVDVLKPWLYEGEYSSKEIAGQVFSMNLNDVYLNIGEWGFLYLSFHKYLVYTLGIMGALGCGVLLIIYATGSSAVSGEFEETGISHIINEPLFYFAPLIFGILFSLILYGFSVFFYNQFVKEKPHEIYHSSQQYAFYIKNINKSKSCQKTSEEVQNLLKNQYGPGVKSVYSVPDYNNIYKNYINLLEYKNKLKFVLYDYEKTGVRPLIRNKYLRKVDGINLYETKIAEELEIIKKSIIQYADTNSGIVFVVCDSILLVNEILEKGLQSNDIDKTDWKFKKAPSPKDIMWQSVGSNGPKPVIIRAIVNLLFVIVFLVVLTPSYFTFLIQYCLSYVGLDRWIGNTIGMYVPTLLLLIYQQLILPTAVDFLVSQEIHMKKHNIVSSGLKKYLFYLIFYILMYPLLGMQFVDLIKFFFNEEIPWQYTFGTRMKETGEFFTIFLIHETFIKNGWDLMVTGKYFASKAKSIIASTSIEKLLAYQCDPFMFDLEFAISLNSFIIACSFSIVYPLILLPALSFFSLRVLFI
jgi:Cytosolic domain of 10TM putative phosphate transporter/Calcium-dependent channel, 7TM region, putative phosphate